MLRVCLCLVFAFVVFTTSAFAQRDCRDGSATYTYTDEVLFNADTNYYGQSFVDGDEFFITLSASHDGYMGFGIPEQTSGSMLGADIVTVGFDTDGIRVADYYVEYEAFPFSPVGGSVSRGGNHTPVSTAGSQLFPRRDCENGGTDDWTLVAASTDVVDGEICQQVTIKRNLISEDVNDRDIVAGTNMNVIWAHGLTAEPIYHSASRGGASMAIGAAIAEAFECNPPECFFRDYVFDNHEILPLETTYVNMDFKILLDGEVGVDYHMIRFEEITAPGSEKYVHHLLLNGCYGNSTDKNLNFTHEYFQFKDDVFDRNPECETNVFIWAVGGDPLVLPPEAGFPAGDLREDQFLYFSLNFHFTNPTQDLGVFDTSGVRVYFSTIKREHDAALMSLGGVGGSVIPQQEELWITQSTCVSPCTDWLPTLNVFASFLHMHSFGQRIFSAQYDSDANFLRYTNRVDFWNFEWQRTVKKNFQIHPGDQFQTICFFNVSKWNENITFGVSTYDEMCLEYFYYWPKIPQIETYYSCGKSNFDDSDGKCIRNNSGVLEEWDTSWQAELSDGEFNVSFEPDFARLQAPAECLSTLQSVTPGPSEPGTPFPLEIIIGAAAGVGLLLVAAVLVLFLRRRSARKAAEVPILTKM